MDNNYKDNITANVQYLHCERFFASVSNNGVYHTKRTVTKVESNESETGNNQYLSINLKWKPMQRASY